MGSEVALGLAAGSRLVAAGATWVDSSRSDGHCSFLTQSFDALSLLPECLVSVAVG